MLDDILDAANKSNIGWNWFWWTTTRVFL